jgi:hypothetical protein
MDVPFVEERMNRSAGSVTAHHLWSRRVAPA